MKNKVMVNGEWCSVNKLMDYMINRGTAVGEAFAKLSKREQADILKGRTTFSLEPELPVGCPKRDWLGSGGDGGCDGCGTMRFKVSDDAPSLDLDVCPRCKYARCAACREGGGAAATCFCKDSNMGVPYPAGERRAHEGGHW